MTGEAARSSWRRAGNPKGNSAACPLCNAQRGAGPSFQESGNYAEAVSTGTRIQTLEQLLVAAGVDLETWQILNWGVKKGEVGAKIKTGHLEWEDGRIDGHLDYEGLGVQDLWSVWAKFVRRVPLVVAPVLQPVACPVQYREPERPRGGLRRALVGADWQVGYRLRLPSGYLDPFHDRWALDVLLQLAALLQPGEIHLLGDLNDNTEMTDKFVRSPEFWRTMQPAVLEVHWWLRQLREAAPGAVMVWHPGNHERRMDDYLAVHLAAAYDLRPADEMHLPPALSMERLLALHELGIQRAGNYPDDLAMLNDGLQLYHGDRASNVPGATARAVADEFDVSTVFGHAHRRELASRSIWRGRRLERTVEAHGVGCLCRIDGAVPAKSGRNNWQQGLAVIDYDEAQHAIYNLEIRAGRLVFEGQVIEARDRIEDLQRDLPDWHWGC
jgi:hypothetical protein